MTDISPNVIDHLTRRFGNQTRLAEAAGVRQSSIAGRKKTNSLSHDQMRRILREGPRMGVAVAPADFFPEMAPGQPEAANDAAPTEQAA
ncbi:hypothetical protein [Phenylobacterium sp.]|uniref:hypothetical protein n=1 Tax=Phenylobacterium sp. TaxID=1871053 RepID=UPI00300277E9